MFSQYYQATRTLSDNRIPRLGNCQNKTCRFCGARQPKVNFRKTAHLLPQSTGNRSLIVCYECDDCNKTFGHAYEDAFGKYTKTYRTMLGIAGRQGIPVVGYQSDYGTEGRISSVRKNENLVSITAHETINEGNLDIENRSVIYRVPLDPYIAWNVLRCLYHSAYLALHASELGQFTRIKSWIVEENYYPGRMDFMCVYRSVGNPTFRRFSPFIELYDRKHNDGLYSKCILIGFSSIHFQFFLPSDQDLQLLAIGNQFNRPKYEWPNHEAREKFGELKFDEVDLSDTTLQRGKIDEVKMPLPDKEWDKLFSIFTSPNQQQIN